MSSHTLQEGVGGVRHQMRGAIEEAERRGLPTEDPGGPLTKF
jgi:hypothetical protein